MRGFKADFRACISAIEEFLQFILPFLFNLGILSSPWFILTELIATLFLDVFVQAALTDFAAPTNLLQDH